AERSLREVELGNEETLVDLYRRQAEFDRTLGRLPAGLEPPLPGPATAAGRRSPRRGDRPKPLREVPR
nr:hypothetical protein [Acidobacteriota bacterium]